MRFSALLALFALALAAHAEPLVLAWPQAVSEAAAQSPELKAAREELRQAQLAVRLALPSFLPTVSANASLGQSGPYRYDGSTTGAFDQGQDSASAGLNASWNLFNGFRDLAALLKARAQLASAEAAEQAIKAQLGYELRAAFLRVLQAQERLLQAEDIAKRRASNVELVSLRFDAGSENRGSLQQTEAQAAQAEYQARRAARDLRQAGQDLARLLGRRRGEVLRVTGDLESPELPALPAWEALLPGLPAVRKAKAAVEAASEDLSAARGAWLPSLGASAGVSRGGRDWLGETGSWSTGLSLSLPLFQGGRRLWAQEAASSGLEAAKLRSMTAEDDAAMALRQSWDAMEDAIELAGVQAKFLQAAQTRAEVAQAQYAQGLVSFTVWDQIESDLINAQIQALNSRGDAQRAAAGWERDLGRSPW